MHSCLATLACPCPTDREAAPLLLSDLDAPIWQGYCSQITASPCGTGHAYVMGRTLPLPL